jgi:hypothetical protein
MSDGRLYVKIFPDLILVIKGRNTTLQISSAESNATLQHACRFETRGIVVTLLAV